MHPCDGARHIYTPQPKKPPEQEGDRSKAMKVKQERTEKVENATKSPLKRVVNSALPPQNSSTVKLYKKDIAELRYAQATMKDTTRDGLPVEQMAKNMAQAGYDRKYPIHVVIMPPGPEDSPLKPQETGKLVAFDTRRTKAARIAAKELSNDEFFAYVKMKNHNELATQEYESLRHLTFENKSIPEFIRKVWITEWDKWHDPTLLDSKGIVPKTWGHLIKLRMAMSMDQSRSNQAETNAGFKVSPFVRKTQDPAQQKEKQPLNLTARRSNLF